MRWALIIFGAVSLFAMAVYVAFIAGFVWFCEALGGPCSSFWE